MDRYEAEAVLMKQNPKLYSALSQMGAFKSTQEVVAEARENMSRTLSLLKGTLEPAFHAYGLDLKEPNYHALAAAVAIGALDTKSAFTMALQMRNAQLNMLTTSRAIMADEARTRAENLRAELIAKQLKVEDTRLATNQYALFDKMMSSMENERLKLINSELVTLGVPLQAVKEITSAYMLNNQRGAEMLKAAERKGEKGGDLAVVAKTLDELRKQISDPARLAKVENLLREQAMIHKAGVLARLEASRDLAHGVEIWKKVSDYWDIGWKRVLDDTAASTAKEFLDKPSPTVWDLDYTTKFLQDHYLREDLPESHASTLADFEARAINMTGPLFTDKTLTDIVNINYGRDEALALATKIPALIDAVREAKAKSYVAGTEGGMGSGEKWNPQDTTFFDAIDVSNDPSVSALLEEEPTTAKSIFSWYTPPSEYPQPERFNTNFDAITGLAHAFTTLVKGWKDILGHRKTLESIKVSKEMSTPTKTAWESQSRFYMGINPRSPMAKIMPKWGVAEEQEK